MPSAVAERWAAIDGDATDSPAVQDMGIDYRWPEPNEPCMNVGLAVQLHWPAVALGDQHEARS